MGETKEYSHLYENGRHIRNIKNINPFFQTQKCKITFPKINFTQLKIIYPIWKR